MKIHILGASGSGTTTLAKALADKLGYKHFDSDDYFWEETNPPYQQKRSKESRVKLLKEDLSTNENWILSGSLCGWGDILIPMFDLVVYLYLPKEIRMDRIIKREEERFGDKIKEGGSMYESSKAFIKWASEYDDGDINMRSKKLHNKWLKEMSCKVLKIEGDYELEENINTVFKYI